MLKVVITFKNNEIAEISPLTLEEARAIKASICLSFSHTFTNVKYVEIWDYAKGECISYTSDDESTLR